MRKRVRVSASASARALRALSFPRAFFLSPCRSIIMPCGCTAGPDYGSQLRKHLGGWLGRRSEEGAGNQERSGRKIWKDCGAKKVAIWRASKSRERAAPARRLSASLRTAVRVGSHIHSAVLPALRPVGFSFSCCSRLRVGPCTNGRHATMWCPAKNTRLPPRVGRPIISGPCPRISVSVACGPDGDDCLGAS